MRDPLISAVLMMATCPGECDPQKYPHICARCPHLGSENCAELVVQRGFDMLQEYRNAAQAQGALATPIKKTHGLEYLVTETILALGIPAHVRGYGYVREAIICAVKDPDVLNGITKELYPAIAKKFKATDKGVERAIRHAIEVAWDRGNPAVQQTYFSHTASRGMTWPTNSEFIAVVADKIRLKISEESRV